MAGPGRRFSDEMSPGADAGRVRVLHVIDSLSASGGAEHGMVREILRFGDDFDQTVVRLFSADALDGLLASRKIPVVPLGLRSSRSGWNWPLAVKRLADVIETTKPDVIHSSLFSSNVVAQVAGRRAKTPVLSTFTLSGDPRLLRAFQPGADSWRAAFLRKVAGYSARSDLVWFRALTKDAEITNCDMLGVVPSRSRVIPRGVPDDLRPDLVKSRAELGLPEDLPLLVNVGRQTAQKGHVDLVESFSMVRRQVPTHLVILGRDGDGTAQLAEMIETTGLQNDVTVVSYTPDVAHYLAHASVFVFSSYMEGLGTAVIEALACEAPVVAYDIPPVREATDDGKYARLVPVGHADALAREIVATIEKRDSDLIRKAAAWARETYSLERVSDDVQTRLRWVARGGPPDDSVHF